MDGNNITEGSMQRGHTPVWMVTMKEVNFLLNNINELMWAGEVTWFLYTYSW